MIAFKGVVHTTKSLKAQMDAMITAWNWRAEDCILNILPLHHVHGIVNCIMTSLYNGSTLVMQRKFNAHEVSVQDVKLQVIFIFD